MAFSADAIANAFLDIAEEAGSALTPMKLQKLAYFAHGWFWAIEDKPFVNEPIYAWKYGPVIQSMYHEFKEFGDSSILRRAQEARFKSGRIEVFSPRFEDETRSEIPPEYGNALAKHIWKMYGGHTAIELSNATHSVGTPWRQIYDQFNGNIPQGIKIPDELIKNYFRARLKQ